MRLFLLVLLLLEAATSFRLERSISTRTRSLVISIRGGARRNDDDDDDDDRQRRPPSRRGPPPSRRPPQRDDYNRNSPSRRRGPPPRRNNNNKGGALTTAASLAKKTADLTSAAAWSTIKGSGKAAFYLVSPKHVPRQDIWGVWRLDQSIEDHAVCAANVEFTPRGDVIVKFFGDDTKLFATQYLFRERNWPQSCTIEFEARAFQGPNDSSPVLMKYKGYFRRKLADPSVVKIVGHIYTVQKKGWRRGDGKKVGTFVARRRLTKKQRTTAVDDDEESDYDDDWADDDDEALFEEDFDDDDNDEMDHEVDGNEFDDEEDFDEDDDESDDEY